MSRATLFQLFITISLAITIQNCFSQELPCKSYYSKEEGGRCKERYSEDNDGEIHGKYISYNNEGVVQERGNYVHGKRDGSWYELGNAFWGGIYLWYEKGKVIFSDNSKPINSYVEALAAAKLKEQTRKESENKEAKEKAEKEASDRKDNERAANEEREWNMWTEALKRSKDEMNPVYLKNFLKEFPESKNALTAKAQIQEIEEMKPDNDAFNLAKQANSAEGYQKYLSAYPDGFHKIETEKWLREYDSQVKSKPDNDAFKIASQKNTINAYINYLIDFPEGIHKNEVVSLLQDYFVNNSQNLEQIREGIESDISSNSKNGFLSALIKCHLIMNSQGRFNMQEYNVIVMYMIISRWALNDVEGAKEIFSEQGKRNKKEFDSVYKLFKKKISLPDEKLNYAKIVGE